ncbi:MAG TPA: hypothetical protein VFJ82_14280 [Longimicrobium sp.]|nr:hypothetical protein [Longimicrobium sp.]
MPQLRIMTWNIRNLGPTKLEHGDIMSAIAKVVVREQPDIFVALEINTRKEATAEAIGAVLQAELQQAEAARAQNNNAQQNNNNNNRQQNNNNNNNAQNAFPQGRAAWDTYAISPNTGVEFYGFFIRDARVVRPMPITANITVLNADNASLVRNQAFVTFGGPGFCVMPLIRPNLVKQGQQRSGRWTGARLPVFGLFNVAGAQDRYLPILAGHFAANQAQAERQMNLLATFDVVNDICVANSTPARPTIDGQANQKLSQLIVTGDFNVDFDPADYPGRLAWKDPGGSRTEYDSDSDDDSDWEGSYESDNNNNNAAPTSSKKRRRFYYGGLLHDARSTLSLGLKAVITRKTHLMKPGKLQKREVKSTEALARKCYDNFFVNAAVTVVDAWVVDVPRQFKDPRDPLQLEDSVEYYADLGKKDLEWSDYDLPGNDVVGQLMTGSGEAVSTLAALTGAALISDHLPVVMDFTLP